MIRHFRGKILHGLKHYLFNILLIWLAILFYRYNPYYKSFLLPLTQSALFYLALTYTVLGLFFYIILPIERIPKSKGLLIFQTFKRTLIDTWRYLKNFTLDTNHPPPKIEKHEKVAILFVLVKLYFLPLMLNFMFGNYEAVKSGLGTLPGLSTLLTINSFNNIIFPLLISLVFFIDTLFFTFGYTFEAGFLKNKIRSVETTALGWIVVLLCYPPFNGLFNNYSDWYANDNVFFYSSSLTFFVRIALILLLFVYVSATLSLGTKSSNLTNRGIVGYGPYRHVRHPAYISKNLFWWITIIPVMNIFAFLSMLSWSVVYFLRAITEERHLIQDPDYQAYCKKVKYRFIPGVW
ncbi:hypothetical protein J4416_04395 [Candidatus Pacearchaeota archaeon]|nr:hypothetical protein [Candidatus Pacearchaeota archaeon]